MRERKDLYNIVIRKSDGIDASGRLTSRRQKYY
jgi:hypothetical protein